MRIDIASVQFEDRQFEDRSHESVSMRIDLTTEIV